MTVHTGEGCAGSGTHHTTGPSFTIAGFGFEHSKRTRTAVVGRPAPSVLPLRRTRQRSAASRFSRLFGVKLRMTSFPVPPEPPRLKADQIRGLIRYAEQMSEYMEAEIARANAEGMGHAVLHLPEIVEGWRFTALAIRETYDGTF